MIGKDTIAYLPSSIVPVLLGLIVMPLYTSLFSPNEYGQYILIITIYSVIQALTSSWLGSSIIRYNDHYSKISLSKNFTSTILLFSLFICSILSTIIFLASILFNKVMGKSMFNMLLLFPFFAILSSQIELRLQFFRASRRINLYNITTILRSILLPIFVWIICLLNKNPINFLLSSILCNTLLMLYKWNSFSISFKNIDTQILKRILKFGLPLAPTFLSSNLIDVSERVLLTAYQNESSVGIYAASQMLSKNPANLLISLITISSAPIIVIYWESKPKIKLENLLSGLAKFLLIILIPISQILFFHSEIILGLFVSDKFLSGHIVMPYLFLGATLLGFQWIFQRALILSEKTSVILIGFLLSLSVNFILGFLLVKDYGILGISLANLFSSLVALIFIWYMSNKIISIKIKISDLIVIIIASTAMFVTNLLGKTILSEYLANSILIILLSLGLYILVVKRILNEFNLLKLNNK